MPCLLALPGHQQPYWLSSVNGPLYCLPWRRVSNTSVIHEGKDYGKYESLYIYIYIYKIQHTFRVNTKLTLLRTQHVLASIEQRNQRCIHLLLNSCWHVHVLGRTLTSCLDNIKMTAPHEWHVKHSIYQKPVVTTPDRHGYYRGKRLYRWYGTRLC